MIHHTVLFRWKPESTEADRQEIATEVAKLPSMIPTVRAFACGSDARLADGNWDFALTAGFDDKASYFSYRDDPGHRDMITRFILPHAADIVAVQFES